MKIHFAPRRSSLAWVLAPLTLVAAPLAAVSTMTSCGEAGELEEQESIDAIQSSLTQSFTTPIMLPAAFQAEDFYPGFFYDKDSGNASGLYRNDTDVDVYQVSANNYKLGRTRNGEHVSYRVDAGSGGSWDVTLRVSSNKSGGEIALGVNHTRVTPYQNVPNTGSWNTFKPITFADVDLGSGTQFLTLYMKASSGSAADIDTLEIQSRGGTSTPPPTTPPPSSGQCPQGLSKTSWTKRADMLTKRGEQASVVYNNKVYLFGGIFNSTKGPADVEVYDIANNSWSKRTTLSPLRNHFTTAHARYGDEVWIAGGKPDGQGHGGSKTVSVYNLKTNTWRTLSKPLPENHWAGPTVILGDKLHVIGGGGSDNEGPTNHHFVLDLKNEAAGWSSLKAVPEPRLHVAGVPFNNEIWLIGGEITHSHTGDTTTVQIYTPSTNSWRSGPPLPEARSHHDWATFTHEGRIWSVSGVDSSSPKPGQTPPERGQNTVYYLDSATQGWKQLRDGTAPFLPRKHVSPSAHIVDGVLYLFGGGELNWFNGSLRNVWARCL